MAKGGKVGAEKVGGDAGALVEVDALDMACEEPYGVEEGGGECSGGEGGWRRRHPALLYHLRRHRRSHSHGH